MLRSKLTGSRIRGEWKDRQTDICGKDMCHFIRDGSISVMYLFHAELTSLQGLTKAHFPVEEAALVYQCGDLLEALTCWGAF